MFRSREESVDFIFDLFERFGAGDYIGEPISQLEHALQAAALASGARASDDAIIAALLHDTGHFHMDGDKMGVFGVAHHERLGAERAMHLGFSENVVLLILGHVEAKRFLTFKNPSYLARLSDASRETLKHQGGPMSATEAARFEADPLFEDYLRIRTWDDLAKVKGAVVPDLNSYREMLLKNCSPKIAGLRPTRNPNS